MSQTKQTDAAQALRERVTAKINKLMSLANSPNEAEALEAMAMAQRLRLAHAITDAELQKARAAESQPAQTVTSTVLETMRQKQSWKGSLASAIANLNGAEIYWDYDAQRQRVIRLLGTEGAIASTIVTYNYLIATTLRLATEGVTKEKALYQTYLRQIAGTGIEPTPPVKWSSWKDKFIQGCANRLQHRVRLLKRELEDEGIPKPATATTANPTPAQASRQEEDAETAALMLPVTALAVRENYALARQSIALYRQEQGIQLTAGRRSSYTVTSAYRAGSTAGGSVSLNRQMGGGGSRPALNS